MVLIARAMVKSPELLILDEPCQGLDRSNRENVLAIMQRIGGQPPTSLLYVTHHSDELLPCITHTLEMKSPDSGQRPLYVTGRREAGR